MKNTEPIEQSKESTESFSSLTLIVVTICWLAVISEGYDLTVYGTVVPALLDYNEWSLTSFQTGLIGSLSLVGLLIGNVAVGSVTDRIGRKTTIILSVTIFSSSMLLCAIAPSPLWFALFRIYGGLGLGGIIPTTTAMTVESSPVKRRSLMHAILLTGYPLGGVLAALLASPLLSMYSWRMMFWIGAIPLLLIPVIIKFLPESIVFLLSRNRQKEAEAVAKRFNISLDRFKGDEEKKDSSRAENGKGIKTLFSSENLKATIHFWILLFMGLLMIYGLNTWLPEIMQQAGYSLGSGIKFLLVLNLAATVGAVVGGELSDRWGSKPTITMYLVAAAISLGLLSFNWPTFIMYVFVAVAGAGAIGASLLMAGYISKYFPSYCRASAVGWAMGVGRLGAILGPLLGGILTAWETPYVWNFYIFSICGFIAVLAILFIPKYRGGKI